MTVLPHLQVNTLAVIAVIAQPLAWTDIVQHRASCKQTSWRPLSAVMCTLSEINREDKMPLVDAFKYYCHAVAAACQTFTAA